MNKNFLILHVEDDANDVLLIERAFRKANFSGKVVFINDGDQALAYLSGAKDYGDRERFPLPTVLMMDVKLPRKSGLEVLAWLRAQPLLRRLPVVMLTSSKQPGDINQAYDSGANCYLIKPVNFDDLIQMIKTLEIFWLNMNQHPVTSELTHSIPRAG